MKFYVDSLESSLGKLNMGVVLLNLEGDIVYHNQLIDKLIETREELSIKDEKLTLCNSICAAKLEKAIHEGSLSGFSEFVIDPVDESMQPLFIKVLPLGNHGHHLDYSGDQPGTLILVFANEIKALQITPDRLANIFDLTPSESRLAIGLFKGNHLNELAETFNIQISTARSQLKSILAKTQCSRQSELIGLLGLIAI